MAVGVPHMSLQGRQYSRGPSSLHVYTLKGQMQNFIPEFTFSVVAPFAHEWYTVHTALKHLLWHLFGEIN